jgi:hypothetical protein
MAHTAAMLNLYRVTAFLSAALLFLAQPMFARQVLPLVGGAPAVWNTCQVFFQVALLAGYLYADASTRWLGVRRQSMLHLALVLAPLVCLPLWVGNPAAPNPESNPSPWLLLLMATTVGPPFLALSATAPLVQRWFAAARRNPATDPYSLYVMSNFGSLVALLAYPLVIEPASTLRTQAWIWSAGYVAWIVCLGLCGYFVWQRRAEAQSTFQPVAEPVAPPRSERKKRKRGAEETKAPTIDISPIAITRKLRFHWLALAAAPVAWMLGATTWITTDIAPIPLLWIVPLAIYLITYMLAFSERGPFFRLWAIRILPWTMCALVASLTAIGIWQLALVHIAAFAVGAMVCHGELARLRPGTDHLTEFYVWLSLGGALGGTFIAIVAPLIFVTPWEYALAVTAGCALVPRIVERRLPIVDLICVVGVAALLYSLRDSAVTAQKTWLLTAALFGFPVMVALYYFRRPWAFAIVVGAILALDVGETAGAWDTIRVARSYFGVHRVTTQLDEDNRLLHQLQHGTTAHGFQFMDDGLQCTPLVYYHRSGPLGEIMEAFAPRAGEKQHIAAVGLGAGAAACYTSPDRDITFFEIDPVVRELAEDPECFTYLSHCAKGRYTIKLGDGRRLLAEEPEGRFAVMLLDAFSSDAIPVHLLTREALALYMSRLTDDGILAFHISNNHLDLAPVLADLAHDAGWVVRVRRDGATESELRDFKVPSTYVVIARQREHLRALANDPRWQPQAPTGRPVWTDDYCNVLSVLK